MSKPSLLAKGNNLARGVAIRNGEVESASLNTRSSTSSRGHPSTTSCVAGSRSSVPAIPKELPISDAVAFLTKPQLKRLVHDYLDQINTQLATLQHSERLDAEKMLKLLQKDYAFQKKWPGVIPRGTAPTLRKLNCHQLKCILTFMPLFKFHGVHPREVPQIPKTRNERKKGSQVKESSDDEDFKVGADESKRESDISPEKKESLADALRKIVFDKSFFVDPVAYFHGEEIVQIGGIGEIPKLDAWKIEMQLQDVNYNENESRDFSVDNFNIRNSLCQMCSKQLRGMYVIVCAGVVHAIGVRSKMLHLFQERSNLYDIYNNGTCYPIDDDAVTAPDILLLDEQEDWQQPQRKHAPGIILVSFPNPMIQTMEDFKRANLDVRAVIEYRSWIALPVVLPVGPRMVWFMLDTGADETMFNSVALQDAGVTEDQMRGVLKQYRIQFLSSPGHVARTGRPYRGFMLEKGKMLDWQKHSAPSSKYFNVLGFDLLRGCLCQIFLGSCRLIWEDEVAAVERKIERRSISEHFRQANLVLNAVCLFFKQSPSPDNMHLLIAAVRSVFAS